MSLIVSLAMFCVYYQQVALAVLRDPSQPSTPHLGRHIISLNTPPSVYTITTTSFARSNELRLSFHHGFGTVTSGTADRDIQEP